MDPVAIAHLLAPDDRARPRSEWTNLGYWRRGVTHPEAARTLAQKLGEAAGLARGQRVVDVGVGCGEQLLLWRKEFGVDEVLAFEPEPRALARAEARCREAGVRVVLRGRDASALAEVAGAGFDRVLALDCAYHFETRREMLAHAHACLAEGGRVALTDLLFSPRFAESRAGRLAGRFGIPRDNLWDEARYREELAAAGFRVLRIERIGDAVLGGFARHVRRAAPRLVRHLGPALPILLTALVAGQGRARDRIDYAIVTATR